MKYNISDYKLKVIVDELGEEYKDLLIERILGDMHENDADLINPSDLIRLDVATKSNLRIDKKSAKTKSYALNDFFTRYSICTIGINAYDVE